MSKIGQGAQHFWLKSRPQPCCSCALHIARGVSSREAMCFLAPTIVGQERAFMSGVLDVSTCFNFKFQLQFEFPPAFEREVPP